MTIILEQWTTIPSFSSNPSLKWVTEQTNTHFTCTYLFKGVVVVPDLSWVYLPIIVHWWATWVHSDGGWRCVLQIGLWMSLWLSSSRMHTNCCEIETSDRWWIQLCLELGLVWCCCCWYPQIKILTRVSLTV
jgi:hypothetical protein